MEKTKVAIVGLGTVGSGVARLLLDHGDRTARHAGRTLWLEKAVVRDMEKAARLRTAQGSLDRQSGRRATDPEIKVVAQLIGGLEPARTHHAAAARSRQERSDGQQGVAGRARS